MNLLLALLSSILPGVIKMRLYRLRGMRIGRNARIGFGTVLLCRDVELADGASIGSFCLIRLRSLRMGKRSAILNLVRISAHSLVMKSQSTICSQNQIAGDSDNPQSELYLGPATWILPHCYVDLARTIRLGRNVGVGGGSYLFTHGMWLSKLDGFPVSHGGITIENDVWLPWRCFIMPNVTIGAGCVIGACALVNRSLPPGVLAAGVPAKVIRDKSNADLSSEQRAAVLTEVSQSLAAKRGYVMRVEQSPMADLHYINESLVLKVHKTPQQPLEALPVLNVIFGPLDRAESERAAVWSLHDYTSSPLTHFSSTIREWFAEARNVGVRYYPIDEDLS